MAITGINDSAKEHENYQNRLRDLSTRFAEENSKTAKRYNENVDNLETEHTKQRDNIRKENDARIQAFQTDNEREIKRLADRFERQASSDSKAFYDRFGKEREANFREVSNLKKLHSTQLGDYERAQALEKTSKEASHFDQVNKLKHELDIEKSRFNDQTNQKVAKVADGYEKQLYENNKEFLRRMDHERTQNHRDMQDVKLATNLQLENIKNQKDNEIENNKRSFEMQKRQLEDTSKLNRDAVSLSDQDSLAQYRKALSENLYNVQQDNNFQKSKRDIEHANALARQNHDSRMREQDQKINFERAQQEAKLRTESERTKAYKQNELEKRRIYNDASIVLDTQKRANQDTIDELNASHSESLRSVQHKANDDFDKAKAEFNNRISKIEENRHSEQAESKFKNQDNARSITAQHSNEKNRIINAYEQKQQILDKKARENKEAQNNYYSREQIRLHRQKEKEIANVNIENQDKLYRQRMKYESMNETQKKQFESNSMGNDDSHRTAMKNLSDRHYATEEELQQIHKAQIEELSRDFNQTLTKTMTAADYTLKTTVSEYEYRIKSMAQAYEQKMTEMELNSQRELNAMRLQHERTNSAATQKHRREIDSVMDSHKKELALLESQYKEKFRLQEDNQKQEIARIKHSNELLRQKS